MALAKAVKQGTPLHALGVDSTDTKVFSKSQQRRFGSEVEIVNGQGKLEDIIYSGEEITETSEKVGVARDAVDGSGSLTTGIITRSSLRYSNEDISKVTTEKLIIPLT
jgi:hypothetical protein